MGGWGVGQGGELTFWFSVHCQNPDFHRAAFKFLFALSLLCESTIVKFPN